MSITIEASLIHAKTTLRQKSYAKFCDDEDAVDCLTQRDCDLINKYENENVQLFYYYSTFIPFSAQQECLIDAAKQENFSTSYDNNII